MTPSPPHPQASEQQVQEFLSECFIAFNGELKVQDAQLKAEKLSVNGKAIYSMTRGNFKDAFGVEGSIIYDILTGSPYSFVS